MIALIKNGLVIQVEPVKFPVHNSFEWVECDDEVKAGFSYKNGVFLKPTAEAPETESEQQLTIHDKIDAIIRKIDNGSDPVFDKIALKSKNKE